MRKILSYLLLLNLLFSCEQEVTNSGVSVSTPPDYITEFNSTDFQTNGLELNFKNNPFSGYVFKRFGNSKDTAEVIGYLNGKKHGNSIKWHSANQLAEFRVYQNGKKNGPQITYWPNGNKRFRFVAKENKYEGQLEQWTLDGKLTQLGNFKNGQEYGVQKMWSSNGKIRSNYIIKNGRRYGLLGTKNCINVSDSIELIK